MISRRRFLLTLPAIAATPRLALAQTLRNPLRKKPLAPPPPTFIYFGTDTAKGVSKGIYLSRFDAATGQISAPVLAAETLRPSYLAISQPAEGHRRIYAVNAVPDASATVTSYLMDQNTGALKEINRVTSAGAGPCYVSLDATGESAFVANYVGSSIATYRVLPDGALSEPVERLDYKDPKFGKRGPVTARQDVPHPHSVHLSPDNRFLIVNDLGSDALTVFSVDVASAQLGPPALFPNNHPGSGPRHIAFHPNGRWIYCINEVDSTIDHFIWSTSTAPGESKAWIINTGQRVKTIAPNFPAAKNTAAELEISPDGNFLYASNRGEDTLVVFSIAPTEGKLTLLQRISSGGKTPRHFTLSPDHRWVVCGNQDSATVTVFRRDGGSGRLSGPVQTLPIDSVMFSLFA